MIHELKIFKSFADAIISGDKNFEVRHNDRGFQKGDKVRFKVEDNFDDYSEKREDHPISKKLYEITYVLNSWGINEGFVVFSIKEAADDNKEDQIQDLKDLKDNA